MLKDGKRSKQERREIVEETLQAGTSVSEVARRHDIHASQLTYWRKLYREGQLDGEPAATSRLLPVTITDPNQKCRPAALRDAGVRRGIIDIDLGHARVRIEGAADADCVRAAVEGLLR